MQVLLSKIIAIAGEWQSLDDFRSPIFLWDEFSEVDISPVL
jgi:hypothetical protein